MINKEFSFLHDLTDDERMFLRNVADKCMDANDSYRTSYTFFISPHRAELVRQVMNSMKFYDFCFYGGYDNAQRCVLGIFPALSDCEFADFPVVPISFAYRKSDKLSHRDFLGSLMSLDIKRECIGDIIVGEGVAVIFVYKTVSPLVIQNITKVGNVGVKLSEQFDENVVFTEKFEEIQGTVSSLRIDCILSLALRLSREKTAKLIKSKGVVINHKEILSSSYKIEQGNVFAVKGYGKFILENCGSSTKKNRIHICIKKYI